MAECGNCERLRVELEGEKRIYELAIQSIAAAASCTSFSQYMRLKSLADEVERDLNLLEKKIALHAETHGVKSTVIPA